MMLKRLLLLLSVLGPMAVSKQEVIRVGSKSFTESYILAEIVAQTIEEIGEAAVQRKFGLGQTGIAFEALRNQEIDLYPEYTGTIAEVILKDPMLKTVAKIRAALSSTGLTISESLGFNNTYALAVPKERATRLSLNTISDLKRYPDLRTAFSHEFMKREDGYPKLTEAYGFVLRNVRGLSHALAYEAVARGAVDLTDIYSTDAKVLKLGLVVLRDDKRVFPDYLSVIFAQRTFQERFPRTWAAIRALEGKISETQMIELNASAEIDRKSFRDVAKTFRKREPSETALTAGLVELTRQHLWLVFVSLLASVVVGLPLALFAHHFLWLGQMILLISGLIQTIPSLALLCFLIPFFGIGTTPALVALFLYGLLPIVRSTYVGLTSIDGRLIEVAHAMGLTALQRVLWIEIPLASPQVLSGVKTSAIINVGTATLAALIGAGGYGVPIVTGLALNDIPTILHGAIPAAVMALCVHAVFELLDKVLVPKGLR